MLTRRDLMLGAGSVAVSTLLLDARKRVFVVDTVKLAILVFEPERI